MRNRNFAIIKTGRLPARDRSLKMKVILNEDVKSLGEEGDVKNVAKGYYRNYLGPRRLAVPYNDLTVAYFEQRKEEIEKRKEAKRLASRSQKEKLESLALEITVPVGRNGKLFGAVSAQTIVELLSKEGFEIERKKIEIPGNSIKSVGNYHFTVKLYEAETAEMKIAVKGKEEEPKEDSKAKKRRQEKTPEEKNSETSEPEKNSETETVENSEEKPASESGAE